MGDTGGDICTMLCGGCCLVLFSGLTNWCNLHNYGSGGCCGNNRVAGCCGSCCNDSFNDDRFEAQVQKDLQKTRDPNALVPNSEQLKPSQGMSTDGLPRLATETPTESAKTG